MYAIVEQRLYLRLFIDDDDCLGMAIRNGLSPKIDEMRKLRRIDCDSLFMVLDITVTQFASIEIYSVIRKDVTNI